MSGNNGERTPLLKTQQPSLTATEEQQRKKNYRKLYHLYGTSLSILFLFAFLINWYRTYLPPPLSDAQARRLDDFPGIHAYNEYLSHFNAPHSANTRENGVMRDWLATVVTDFQKDATKRGLQMDIVGHDDSVGIIEHNWFTPSKVLQLIYIYKNLPLMDMNYR